MLPFVLAQLYLAGHVLLYTEGSTVSMSKYFHLKIKFVLKAMQSLMNYAAYHIGPHGSLKHQVRGFRSAKGRHL